MIAVYEAEAYRASQMGSFGNAEYMLIRQYSFPHEYDPEKDVMRSWDSDRISYNDRDHSDRCFKEHIGSGESFLEFWVVSASDVKVLAFVKDILKSDPNVRWNGFRVLGTVNRSNGYPVWTFQLFCKHPESVTKVFDTGNAPHLIHGSRHTHR